MITGDHAVTAEAMALLGITGRAITGAEFAAMDDETLKREIDGIGVIARVAPEDKVHLVDILKAEGPHRRDDRRRRERRPGAQEGRHRRRHGHHRHRGLEGGRGDDLTDDNFATIVKAVELGRALYDNLVRYIRFQMAGLFGFIGTFLFAASCSSRTACRSCRFRRCG